MRNLISILLAFCVLLYGYFSFFPKRFILRHSAQIVQEAELSEQFRMLCGNRVQFESPRLELGSSTFSKLVYSVPVVCEDSNSPKYLMYVTICADTETEGTLFRWNIENVSADI